MFKKMCRSTGQPVVPRLWVAQGCSGTRHRSVCDLGSGHKCASLLPLWRLSSGRPLLLRAERLSGRQCSKGCSKGRRLWGGPAPHPRGAITSLFYTSGAWSWWWRWGGRARWGEGRMLSQQRLYGWPPECEGKGTLGLLPGAPGSA